MHGITPKMLLEEAYSVKDAQISQAPPWFDTDRYDIDAKPEEPVGAAIDKLPRDDQKDKLMQMVQALLADRFKLAISHESKEMPIYAMVVAKGGPKMKVSDFKPPERPEALPPTPPKSGDRAMRGRIMMRPGNLTSTGIEMRMLADALSSFTGRPVIDKTNLSGRYEFTLQWTPNTPVAGMGAPGGPEAAPAPESSGPSLFTAIREQLGLRLESQKAPMDVLVVTHPEKPSRISALRTDRHTCSWRAVAGMKHSSVETSLDAWSLDISAQAAAVRPSDFQPILSPKGARRAGWSAISLRRRVMRSRQEGRSAFLRHFGSG